MSRPKIEKDASDATLRKNWNNGVDNWRIYFKTPKEWKKSSQSFWQMWHTQPERKKEILLRDWGMYNKELSLSDSNRNYALYFHSKCIDLSTSE